MDAGIQKGRKRPVAYRWTLAAGLFHIDLIDLALGLIMTEFVRAFRLMMLEEPAEAKVIRLLVYGICLLTDFSGAGIGKLKCPPV